MTEANAGLWFVKAYRRLGLPLWAGVALSLLIELLLYQIFYYFLPQFSSGGWVGALEAFFPGPLIFLVYAQFGSYYSARTMERLFAHAESMGAAVPAKPLVRLYSFGIPLAIFGAYFIPVAAGATLIGGWAGLAETLYPFQLAAFFLFNFVWVYSYSMFALYRIGKRQINLSSFAADRTLGLRPFGSGSLKLMGLYELFIVGVILVPNLILGTYQDLQATNSSLAFFGFLLFFLPLVSFRRKLIEAKTKELGWIGSRLDQLLKQLKGEKDPEVSAKINTELAASFDLRREISQIHSWPFDVGIISRFAAIIFSVVAILLASYLRTILHF